MWKDIKGFDNYEVSNMGEVRNKKSGRFLKLVPDKYGYLTVHLCSNGKKMNKKVHRLVATTFIPNPDNKPQVNHINEIKTDNRVENLNWMTNKENMNWGTRAKRTQKAVYALYSDETDEYFPSIAIATRELRLYQGGIAHVLKGKQKTIGGLRFEYAE